MKNKRDKTFFWLFGSPMNKSYTKQQSNKKFASNLFISQHDQTKEQSGKLSAQKELSFVKMLDCFKFLDIIVRKTFFGL